jgi:hypothetical protein
MTLLQEYIEEIADQVVSEKIRSTSKSLRFNFEEFKAIKNYRFKMKYAQDRLKQLGCGSSRCAFVFSSGKVLKIARYEGEYEQNRREIEAFEKFGAELLPKIYAHDPEYSWLVVEPSRTFSSGRDFFSNTGFREIDLVGIGFQIRDYGKSLLEALDAYNNIEKYLPVVFEALPTKGKELLTKFYKLISQGMDDIDRFDHWGWASDQRIVCVDPGIRVGD